MTDSTNKPATKRPRRMAREPQTGAEQPQDSDATTMEPAPAQGKKSSKVSLVLDLLSRRDGATVDQLVEATGWLPHTTRAALTGLKKRGHLVTSDKIEGRGRIYRVAQG